MVLAVFKRYLSISENGQKYSGPNRLIIDHITTRAGLFESFVNSLVRDMVLKTRE